MLRNKPEYYAQSENDLLSFFYQYYFAPLIETVEIPVPLKNAGGNPLISAINAGQVQYKDGVYSGKFNARISRELSKYAKYDIRSKTWNGFATPETKFAAIRAEGKRQETNQRLIKAIDQAEANVNEAIKKAPFGDSVPIDMMGNDIKTDLQGVGVMPNLDPRTIAKLRSDYTNSQRLNIKNWNGEQVKRLRNLVEQYQTTGTNGSLLDMIQSEWNTSAAKARFLARQETGLFFEALSRNRAAGAGVRKYRWSTSHDVRVRDAHLHLQGQIFDINGEGGIVDLKTGRRAHAGADYNCRCAKIWVLE